MSFRAIFFDIDGTLLGRDKRMPPSTLHALKKARENGVLLFVATGRVTPMTYFLRDYFDFDGFAAMTGQYCFDKNGKVLHTLAIDPEDIRRNILKITFCGIIFSPRPFTIYCVQIVTKCISLWYTTRKFICRVFCR